MRNGRFNKKAKLGAPNLVLMAFCVVFLQGCISIGPKVIEGTRTDYNHAVQNTDIQQLLLNLVRLHHDDTILFIDVSSITSTTSVSNTSSLTIADSITSSIITDSLSFTDSLTLTDTPVITYTPIQGSNYVQELLTPLSLNQFVLLSDSGWDAKRLLLSTVKQIAGMHNDVYVTEQGEARFSSEFLTLSDLMDGLQREHHIKMTFLYTSGSSSALPVLHINKNSNGLAEVKKLRKMLNLSDELDTFYFSNNLLDEHNSKVVYLETRSLIGVLKQFSRFLTQSGEGYCVSSNHPIFNICMNDSKPKDEIFSRVRYGDDWYYIGRNDKQTKRTIAFLSQLFAMQSGSSSSQSPTITIPIN